MASIYRLAAYSCSCFPLIPAPSHRVGVCFVSMPRFLRLFCFSLVLWGLLLGLLFGKMALQTTIDVQMHNTYFVLGNYSAQIGLLLLTFLVVLVAGGLKRRARENKPLLGLLRCSGCWPAAVCCWSCCSAFHPYIPALPFMRPGLRAQPRLFPCHQAYFGRLWCYTFSCR